MAGWRHGAHYVDTAAAGGGFQVAWLGDDEVLRSMIKNTAGQKIGAQMVTAADGSAFTGSVTVSVTLDAGTQATGSVGSGACTHEGNGYHTYAPAQAETNGTLIAFTFTGSGAVPRTVQVFSTGYDPTLANIPVNVAQFGGSNLTSASGIPEVKVASIAANAINAAAIAADAITDAKVASDVTIASVTGAVGSVTGAVGSVTGNVGGNVTGSVGSVVAMVDANIEEINGVPITGDGSGSPFDV
jgi:hypothetical protein